MLFTKNLKKSQRKHTIILTYAADETVYPNQRINAGTQRAHCGMATDLRNARRRRPNDARDGEKPTTGDASPSGRRSSGRRDSDAARALYDVRV